MSTYSAMVEKSIYKFPLKVQKFSVNSNVVDFLPVVNANIDLTSGGIDLVAGEGADFCSITDNGWMDESDA